uniref:Metaxin n=1 Tax=Tetraodon nigroviridis TaxID=99883 RepID=H3DD85_TETNG
MAAAMELRCWGGGWGLPSVHAESLVVLAYAKFSGAKVTVSPIDWTWRTLTATVPELSCGEVIVQEPTSILNFLRKQRFNADYELSAREGADTMAYIALIDEKLRPALLHTFWVDAENYVNLTRPWFASRSPFPLNLVVPGRQANAAFSRILLTKGEAPLQRITEVEAKIYSEAKECLNLLSYRLGSADFFFGKSPTSLDAFVFGLCSALQSALPSSPLQRHLTQLENITRFCDSILALYFSPDRPDFPPRPCPGSPQPVPDTKDANLQKLTQLVNKESNLIEKMDDNLRSSPQHKSHRADLRASLAAGKSSTPA